MKSHLLFCGLALFAAEAAHAKSADKAFDGFKAGVSVGRSRTSLDKPVAGETATFDRSGKSVDWRGYVGYDLQTNANIVIGAELGLAGGGKSFREKVGATIVKVDPRRSFDVSARIGYAIGNRILLFGKAGWSRQHFNLTATRDAIGAKPIEGKIKENGFLYGAGAEFALTPSLAIRGEYDRVKFNDDLKRDRLLLGGVLRF